MKKLNCIIVDDEPLAVEGIELYVDDYEQLNLVGTFNDAISANEFIQNNPVDLIFLDIEMPKLSGLDFLKTTNIDALVILTTAYPQFALEAFELNVVDYLVKPIGPNRFMKAINKVNDLYQKPPSNVEEISNDYIYIKADRKYVKVFYEDIKYIKGLKDYVIIYTENERIITAINIKTIYNELPKHIFARTSKSYIINVNSIKAVNVDTILIGEEELPLGKTYKDDFLSKHVKSNLIQRPTKKG
ncbi:LytR/AlgR family response regulator transcription factor [Pseudofulvibacter geojedonensis]|uniref:LytR/AlgR family response regulator transcription factor n=1 Tax=Pseudofulvibacter geojedonensis TaxID=1123758 RepID=A0ABW3I370_9FLAO